MRVAVLLSGCGYLDGAEIHESVLCLLVLAQKGHEYHCFAPEIWQSLVKDHLTGKVEETERRSVLKEAARIARGKISPLSELSVGEFDAIVIPGGFGVASNLSTFAQEKEKCSVNEEVKEKIYQFYREKKPIGATCISPVVIAKIFQGTAELTMTLGGNKKSNDYLEKMGMKAVEKTSREIAEDKEHKIFTTPAYMGEDDLAGMFEGIKMVIEKMEKY